MPAIPEIRVRKIVLMLASAFLMASAGQLLMGQAPAQYYEVPFDQSFLTQDVDTGDWKLDDKKLKPLFTVKSAVLLGNANLQENAAAFDQWYTGYVFRGFSQLNQMSKLPERRKEIVDDLRRARSKEVHDRLLDLTTKYMKVFVTSTRNFHPAVRFNAMLLIGDLNADEVSAQQRFPNPHPASLDFLIAEYKRPNQTDALKLAAMIGISRHVQLDWARPEANRIAADRRQEIMNLMLAMVNAKEPPEGKSKEGHAWLQRRAVDILSALGGNTQAEIDSLNQAVLGIVRDPDADLSLRITAAGALGRLNDKAKAKPKIEPAKESLQLAALLMQACNRDLADILKMAKTKGAMGTGGGYPGSSGMGMPGMSMPGMGSGMSMPGMSMPGMSMPGSGMSGSGMPGMSMPGMSMPGAGMPDDGFPGAEGEEDEGMMSAMGSMGMMSGGPKDPYVDLFRRKMKHEIQLVLNGLGGMRRLSPAAPPASGKKVTDPIEQLIAAVTALRAATDGTEKAPMTTLPALYKSVKEGSKDLEKLTAAVMPKPKPEEIQEPSDVPADAPVGAPAVNAAVGVGPADVVGAAPAPAPRGQAAGGQAAAGVPAAAGQVPAAAGNGNPPPPAANPNGAPAAAIPGANATGNGPAANPMTPATASKADPFGP